MGRGSFFRCRRRDKEREGGARGWGLGERGREREYAMGKGGGREEIILLGGGG